MDFGPRRKPPHRARRRGLAPAQGDGDLFRWAGPDGSELLLYHLPRDGYEIGAALPDDPHRLREAWLRIREMLDSPSTNLHGKQPTTARWFKRRSMSPPMLSAWMMP